MGFNDFFRLQENVIGEDDYEKENNGDNDPPPAASQYLRKRRNAVGKVKPIRTLRKRIHTDVNASSNVRNNAKPGFQVNLGSLHLDLRFSSSDQLGSI